jgi:hypothetical protein
LAFDGAFVKGRPPTDRANLEIITGRIEADAEPRKVFAVVRDQDGRAKQDVQALIRKRGRGLETKVRVVSDGEDGVRSMAGKWFNVAPTTRAGTQGSIMLHQIDTGYFLLLTCPKRLMRERTFVPHILTNMRKAQREVRARQR